MPNKGGTAIHKPRPFLGLGFFCVHFYKRKILKEEMYAGTFTRTSRRSVAKIAAASELKELNEVRVLI